MKEGWKKRKSQRLCSCRCGFSSVCFEAKIVSRKV